MSDDIDWIEAANIREMHRPERTRSTVQIDPFVSQALGRPILVNDPRLVQLVVKWKKKTGSAPELDRMDNFMRSEGFLKELHRVFNGS